MASFTHSIDLVVVNAEKKHPYAGLQGSFIEYSPGTKTVKVLFSNLQKHFIPIENVFYYDLLLTTRKSKELSNKRTRDGKVKRIFAHVISISKNSYKVKIQEKKGLFDIKASDIKSFGRGFNVFGKKNKPKDTDVMDNIDDLDIDLDINDADNDIDDSDLEMVDYLDDTPTIVSFNDTQRTFGNVIVEKNKADAMNDKVRDFIKKLLDSVKRNNPPVNMLKDSKDLEKRLIKFLSEIEKSNIGQYIYNFFGFQEFADVDDKIIAIFVKRLVLNMFTVEQISTLSGTNFGENFENSVYSEAVKAYIKKNDIDNFSQYDIDILADAKPVKRKRVAPQGSLKKSLIILDEYQKAFAKRIQQELRVEIDGGITEYVRKYLADNMFDNEETGLNLENVNFFGDITGEKDEILQDLIRSVYTRIKRVSNIYGPRNNDAVSARESVLGNISNSNSDKINEEYRIIADYIWDLDNVKLPGSDDKYKPVISNIKTKILLGRLKDNFKVFYKVVDVNTDNIGDLNTNTNESKKVLKKKGKVDILANLRAGIYPGPFDATFETRPIDTSETEIQEGVSRINIEQSD